MSKITAKQNKKQNKTPWLDPYKFKAGQSGNPKGRPPGKSLKTWVREYFEQLPEEDKMDFLNRIDPEMAWRMAEGNPENQTDHTSKGEQIMFVPSELMKKNDIPQNTESSSKE
jgi:hypothetical protein